MRAMLLMVSAMFLVGCTPSRTYYHADPGTDFTQIKTYSWGSVTERGLAYRKVNGKPVVQAIKDDLDRALASRGLRRVETGGDAIVSYYGKLEYKPGLTEKGATDESPDAMEKADSVISQQTDPGPVVNQAYPVGTIVVYMHDPSGKKEIWRGVAEGVMKQTASDDQRLANLGKIVDKLLAKYPPKK